MTKRYYYILTIIFVLIAVVVVEQIMVTNSFSNVENKVTEIIELVEDKTDINTPQIYDKVIDLEKTWQGYETALCFLVNLKDIEDLGIEITKMKVYVVENNITEFKASLSLMLYFINGYYKSMGISFENIF